MTRGRLETLTNLVVAVVIAIMVLQLAPPRGATIEDLFPLWPAFAAYILSFVYLAIYWTNHYRLLQAAMTVSRRALWANVLFLLGLSLVPFGTAWIGETAFASIPMAVYGVILALCAFGYRFVVVSIRAAPGSTDAVASRPGPDIKNVIWPVFYAIAIPTALIAPPLAFALYVFVAATWTIPGPRSSSVRSHQ